MSYDENRISDLIDGGLIEQKNQKIKELLIFYMIHILKVSLMKLKK